MCRFFVCVEQHNSKKKDVNKKRLVQKTRRGGRDERVRQKRATTMPTTKDEIEEENEIENVYTNEYYTRMSPSSCDWSEENIIAVGCKAGPFVLLIVRFIVSLILIPFLLLRYRRRRRRHRHHHHHNAHFCLFLLH